MLKSKICKCNYPPHKNSGLNINKMNTQNNQIGKPGINRLFITKLNYCMIILENTFLKSQIDDKLVTM